MFFRKFPLHCRLRGIRCMHPEHMESSMQMSDHNPAGRCARALLALFRKHANHRLSESELNHRREEVNRELSEMGDEAIAEALHSIYRLAEADARRRARDVSRAMAARRSF